MQITRKAEYAIRMMLDLALNSTGKPVQTKEIAARQEIPLKFLPHIVAELNHAGLVGTARGREGGIWLLRRPDKINIKQIVEAIQGPIALNQCLISEQSCVRRASCVIYGLWYEAQRQLVSVLKGTSLKDLVDAKQGNFDRLSQRRKDYLITFC
jgi:Rrf2 family protein